MTWTRVGDDFNDRPDLAKISRSARLLHVEGLVYCNKHTTDGELPASMLRRISDSDDLETDVKELAEIGLWTPLGDTAWQLPWLDQEPAEVVETRKAAHRERQRRYERRKALHAAGDHSECDARYCKKKKSDDASGDESLTAALTPSRPDPSRPKGQGTGEGGAGARSPDGARGAPRVGEDHNFVEDKFGGCAKCNLPAHHPIHAEHPHPFVRLSPETATCRVCGQTDLGWLHQGESDIDAADNECANCGIRLTSPLSIAEGICAACDKKYGSGRKAS